MSDKTLKKTSASAIGVAMAGSLMLAGSAGAAENPFGMTELNGGYMQTAAAHMEGKCGGNMKADKPMEGKCGGNMKSEKPMEGKCGAGKCGGNMKDGAKKGAEGKCGAGKCGGSMKSTGTPMKGADGKCGAGKCGGNK